MGRVTIGVKGKFLEDGKNSKKQTGYHFIFEQMAYFLVYQGCGLETPHGGIFIQSMTKLQLLHSAPKQRMTWFEGLKTDVTDKQQKMT